VLSPDILVLTNNSGLKEICFKFTAKILDYYRNLQVIGCTIETKIYEENKAASIGQKSRSACWHKYCKFLKIKAVSESSKSRCQIKGEGNIFAHIGDRRIFGE
jgi:hypothetical protein